MRRKIQVFLNISVAISLVLINVWGGPGVSKAQAKSSKSDVFQTVESASIADKLFSDTKNFPDQISSLVNQPNHPISTGTPTIMNTVAMPPTEDLGENSSALVDSCNLYPIALSEELLANREIGDEIDDIYYGSQPGNFGWLTWSGSPSVPTLVTSLTTPGDSHTYINPNDNSDNEISIGDWVWGNPGVSNSSSVRKALDHLKTIDIDIPVWNISTDNGNNTQYQIVDFARIRLTDYHLPGENRISVQYLGFSCESGTPTPTPSSTPTDIPTMTQTPSSTNTPTASSTPSQTLTPTDTATPTITQTATSTDTPTASSTPSQTPTNTPTPTFTATNTFTPTFTPTNTFTPTFTSTPTATLPNNVSCFSWQGGDLHGWIRSPWMNPGAQIIADGYGLHGSAENSGSYEVGAFFAMPPGSYKVLFSGQNLSGITVAQESDAPTSFAPLSNVIQRDVNGSYFVTDAYLEVRWMINEPIDMAITPIFETFCLAPFAPTPTRTPSPTPTQANMPPQVNAGPDQFVVLPAMSAKLNGAVYDDGLPFNTLTISWSQVSGPGVASFSDPDLQDTNVVFSEAGVYILRLTANDGEYATSDDIKIDIQPPADLIVESVSATSIVFDGQTLQATGSVSAVIKNIGTGLADGAFKVVFFEDINGNKTYEAGSDNLLGWVVQNGLEPSASATVSAPISGTLLFRDSLIYAFVDAEDNIIEINEDNNINYNAGVCEFTPTTAPFSPVLEWQWIGGTTLPTYNQVMMAPVVADLNEDGIPDIVFSSFAGSSYSSNGHLRAISGHDGSEIFTVTNSLYDVRGAGSIAIGDIDLDGRYEIVAVDESGNRLIVFEHDGEFKWRSPSISGGINYGGAAIADLDADGIPEIIVGSTVLNNDGTVRWAGAYGKGNNSAGPLSLIADLDLDGVPEIVAGYTAYRTDGSTYWNNTSLADGFNAVGNFDSDPFPEIVLVSAGKLYLLEHNGAIKWGPITLPGGGRGGAPTIADMDNDGELEIGVAGSTRYTVFETDGTVKWSKVIQDGSSHRTGSTVFDFEADGSVEVIYRDELMLRIYRGTDGTVLWETPSTSGTTYELPVIADVDADGNAEIVMVSNNYNRAGGTTGIQVYGDLADQWVATRQIWNQHTYHITNINDDGSIPRHEINNWDVYNNYRLNTLTAGCVYAKPDLTASYVRKSVSETAVVLTVRIGNGGGILAGANVPVAFYNGDPASGGDLLGTAHTNIALKPGQFNDVTLTLPSGTIALPVWVVADDDGTGYGLHTELNEDNNKYNSHVYLTLTPNLAPVVNAGAGQEIEFTEPGVSTSLNGMVSDDGLPINLLTHFWTMSSGAGNVVFTDAAALTTMVSFDQPGIYVLRLIASDDELSAYDEVTVTVAAPPTPTPTPTAPPIGELTIPGWIASPANQSSISGSVPIILASDITLQDGKIQYWPANDRTAVTTLADNLSGAGGSTLASLDTTLLANGSYVIMLSGTDTNGTQMNSAVMVTVTGEYKPGRVRFTINDLTVPVTGLPIVIGRTYDSLERNRAGDFGNGWSLAIANPRLETDPAHNVTLTMPDGKRVTFYFTPQSYGGWFGFFLQPNYTPGAGVYGSLEVPDCLVVVSGGKYYCYLESGEYSPETYTYTDPYGRKFLMSDEGTLKSITDLNNNVLTFTPNGITSSMGDLNVPFVRDPLGRITQVTDPAGGIYKYTYDAHGNLSEVSMPGVASPLVYHYDSSHFFLNAVDPRGNTLIIDTYYPDGRLESETDALGNTWSYAYDVPARTTTVTNPDNGRVVSVYDDFGNLLSQTNPLGNTTTFTYDNNHNLLAHTNALGQTTSFTYDSNGHPNSIKNSMNQTLGTITYNQYGGPTSIKDGLGRTTTIAYDAQLMPIGVSDSLGSIGGYTWDARGNPLTRSNGEGEISGFTYDQYGNVTRQTDPLGNSFTYTYDSLGRLLTSTDPLGQTTTFAYDALGRTLSATDAASNATLYEYDPNGNLLEAKDALGHVTAYTYDIANRVSTITYPDNTSAHFTYDFRGNLLTSMDAVSRVTQYTYDKAGQLSSITYASGSPEAITIRYEYDSLGRKVKEIDPLGRETLYAYDSLGRLVSSTNALGNVTTNTYDIFGQLLSRTDSLNRTTTYAYDARGRLTLTTYPDGTTTRSAYDNADRLISFTDQAGRVTRYEYNATGQMLSMTSAYNTTEAATTSYLYDSVGRRVAMTNALGHSTSFAYDNLGRLLSITDPLGRTSFSSYNAIGQLTSSTDANGHTTRYTYDVMGRNTQTTFADLSKTSQTYNSIGQVIGSTDQNNKTTSYSYDLLGRLLSVTNPKNETVAYTYDFAGNLLTITDANSHTTSFAYDALNRQTQKTWADGSIESFDYNAAGNRIAHHLTDGNINTFAYDEMNRISAASYFDGNAVTFTYTPNGLPDTVTDLRGVTRYTYNTRGNLTRILQPNGQAVNYTYDLLGNRLSISTSAGTTNYDYDAASQLIEVTGPNNAVTTFAYDNIGLRTQKALSNGITTNYSYDTLNRLTDINQQKSGATLASYAYLLDAAGNRLSVTEADGSSIRWTYDDAYRLTNERRFNSANGLVFNADFTYDPAGNRLSQNVNGSTTNYTYNELDQLLTAGPIHYQYDLRGNMISATNSGQTVQYGYDAQNRQTSVAFPDGTNIANIYDVGGHRVQQSVNSQVTNYLWDEASIYGNVVLETGSGNTTSYVLAGSELLSQTHNGFTSYYLQDGQGSTRTLTNNAGSITDTYSYSAFGELQNQTGSTINHYLYTGQQFDASSGLYSLRARYYLPSVGRFLSQDTFGINFSNPIELNRYVYTANNPTNYTDPSGNQMFTEYAINLAKKSAAAGAIAGAGFGLVNTFICGGNALINIGAGALLGAGFGAGAVLAPSFTAAVGSASSLFGYISAAENIKANGPTACNIMNAAMSLIGFGAGMYGGLSGGFGGGLLPAFAGNNGNGYAFASTVQGVNTTGVTTISGVLGILSLMASSGGQSDGGGSDSGDNIKGYPTSGKVSDIIGDNPIIDGIPVRAGQNQADGSFVIKYYNAMISGKFNWNAMGDKIQLIRDSNGYVIGDGHHRFIAAMMARIEIPKGAITIIDVRPNIWPNSYNWSQVFWSGY